MPEKAKSIPGVKHSGGASTLASINFETINSLENPVKKIEDGQKFRVFIIICVGQFVSILGSGLTNFAIGIWVFQKTGSVTNFALTILAIAIPSIVISPFAGAFIDRWDRRRTMMLADTAAGMCSLAMGLLLYVERLQIWHVCLIIAFSAVAGFIQKLAFTASAPLLVSTEQLGRASGLMEIGPAVAQIASPLLAGMLLVATSIYWVLVIDFATFLFAVSATAVVRIPKPTGAAEGESAKGSLLNEAVAGWALIKTQLALTRLLYFFAIFNFILSALQVVLTPMWFGIASVEVVGRMASISSFGMLAGSIALSVWGGPSRRIRGVLGFTAVFGLCLILMGLRPSIPLISAASFGLLFTVPIILGCNQAIWLSQTQPDMQGRVGSIRMMIESSATPLAYLIAGPLADKIFEPLLAADGPLAGSLGKFMGVGPGRGIALLVMTLGALVLLLTVAGCMNSQLRNVETEPQGALVEEASIEGADETAVESKSAASF
jgi:MFS family permease